ncbi:hypothetical protein BH09PAT2_BH09PAT2_09510 [soil metagenome]
MKKIIQYTIISALLFTVGIFLYHTVAMAAEVAKKSLRIVLDQGDPALPAALSVTIENNNPNRYMVIMPSDFIIVKELDVAGTVLYEGQVKRSTGLPKSAVAEPAIDAPIQDVIDNPLIINFPYFDEARRVKIFAEDGTTLLLDIDLGIYGVGITPTPEPRSATCNKCGYCKGKKDPGNLEACMTCLYPGMTVDETLVVDPIKNQPPKPRIGAYYSQLGCVDVGIAGFRDASAAGGVVNVILTRLFFPITGVLALLSLIYGAFLLITAQGNEEQIGRGRRWIMGAIVGVVFTFMVILLIRIIAGDVLKIPGFDL